jgi:hypothetical protein
MRATCRVPRTRRGALSWVLPALTRRSRKLITSTAEAKSAATLAMLSGRLIETLREIGKLTGEIDRLNPSINVTTNVAIMSDPRMIELQSGLLTIARAHNAARGDIIAF